MSIRVNGIDHVGLAVRAVARSCAWYESVLGLERRYEDVWGDYPGVMASGETSIAFFPSDDDGEPERARTPLSGFRHVAFVVDRASFDAAQTQLAELGIGFELEDHEIVQSLYFSHPDGYVLELTTYL